MAPAGAGHALEVERTCALVAFALSAGRRKGARLLSGDRRCFGTNDARTVVHVPYPALASGWTLRTLTCGVALQCAPSKERLARCALQGLTGREVRALTLVEAAVALRWIGSRWPGLVPELRRVLPELEPISIDLDARAMLDQAISLARADDDLRCDPLLGQLPQGPAPRGRVITSVLKLYGRMPWSDRKRALSPLPGSVPVGGEGGARSPNEPPPSRPEDDEIEVSADRRLGIPYPEWNVWTQRFLTNHVAVVERRLTSRGVPARPSATHLHRWFEEHTHRAMTYRLEEGSDLDVDRYIEHHVDVLAGRPSEPRVFKDLLPGFRDVTTALLLDGSSSMGVGQGRLFRLQLACADALCHAMARARERHGLFTFTGKTRHRVEVTCLKDFEARRVVVPTDLGLTTGGYTRLGAPLRHLTSRLKAQPTSRRVLVVLGDGLISDDGYEGRYAWADSAHAVAEATEAGVTVHYIGVGETRVDPLPDVFGPRRSTRIRRVQDLPRVLAQVHRELAAA